MKYHLPTKAISIRVTRSKLISPEPRFQLTTQLSRPVTSNQKDVHDGLDDLVLKHLNSRFLKPFDKHNVEAYQSTLALFDKSGRDKPLILDSGCGNGSSTRKLAELFPNFFIVGIDKSAARIEKGTNRFDTRQSNFCVVRADLIDFWRLALNDGLTIEKHFILYPNPWPKSQHIQRRWHGSPVFKTILELGGELELRSNWKTYTLEFQQALRVAGVESTVNLINTDNPNDMTDFETKYRLSDHQLWQLTANLNTSKPLLPLA